MKRIETLKKLNYNLFWQFLHPHAVLGHEVLPFCNGLINQSNNSMLCACLLPLRTVLFPTYSQSTGCRSFGFCVNQSHIGPACPSNQKHQVCLRHFLLCGCIGAWEHGSMGAWEHGSKGAWVQRCIVVWMPWCLSTCLPSLGRTPPWGLGPYLPDSFCLYTFPGNCSLRTSPIAHTLHSTCNQTQLTKSCRAVLCSLFH